MAVGVADRKVVGAALAGALLAVTPWVAHDASAAAAQACDASSYRLTLSALTDPPRADLTIRIAAAAECELPGSFSEVHVTVFTFKGTVQRRVDLRETPAPGGTRIVRVGQVARFQRVATSVTFSPQITLAGQTRTLQRPDLVLSSLKANRISLSGRPFFVTASVRNPTPDAGSTATVSVTEGRTPTTVGTMTAAVGARRRVVLRIPVTLQAPGRTRLTVTISGATPAERTTANNRRLATVDVAEFRVQASSVVVPSFAGYGGQFNHHVYATLSREAGVTDENVVEMERKMRALHPQFSRIFFTPQAFTDPDKMQSFVRTVLFAQSTGTTINVTWQGGTLSVAAGTVQKFAGVLTDLVRNRGVTHLRWLTLQNEPNRTRITPEQYEAAYRALDPYIQDIRGQVRYMGGDLVRGPDVGVPNQDVWFQYLAAHMSDILDAYSIHVFWDYWDTQKLEDRLTEVRAIVDALPEAGRKPVYVTEYGVRGLRTFNGARQIDPGVWEDGTPITQTSVSAFEHAWFDVLAARLGYIGTSKWDSYFGKYDAGTQAFYMIGAPQNGWPLYPLYNFIQLLTTTVKREWKIVAVDSVPDTSRLLAAYIGKKDQRTVVGLDTAGAQLNAASPVAVSYTIGGLPAAKTVRLAIWNEAGDGLVGPIKAVKSDSAGVVQISIPQHAVFVLTSLRLA